MPNAPRSKSISSTKKGKKKSSPLGKISLKDARGRIAGHMGINGAQYMRHEKGYKPQSVSGGKKGKMKY